MVGLGTRRELADLLVELARLGAITVTTPDRKEGALDIMTVIQIDGDVIMRVSEKLLHDPARLEATLEEHWGRVAHAIEPLNVLQQMSTGLERTFGIVLTVVPQLGWIVNAVHIYRTHGDFLGRTNLILVGIGAFGAPLGYAMRGYVHRLFVRLLRWGLSRALPAARKRLFGGGGGS